MSPLQPQLSEGERGTVQLFLVPVDGSRSSEMAAGRAQAPQQSHNHNVTGSQRYKIQHNEKLSPAPSGDQQHRIVTYTTYRHLYIYTLRRLKRVLSIYNIALHTNQYCKPRVGEDEILERIFYCDEALGETAQRGCGCFILASVQGPAGCGFE